MLLTKLRLRWLDIGQVIVLCVLLERDVVEPACVKESFNFGSKLIPYGLLTKREVKMARYWPSSFLRDLLYGIKHQKLKNFPAR